ncbi:hypothetical protein D9M71_293050 [compost metagenome]
MQHAIDAKAHGTLLAARLDVDVAGALLEGVLEQPVDDVDDVRVVGVRLLILRAEVEQLLEVANPADLLLVARGAADRARQAVELGGEALDVRWVGHHPQDRPLEHVGQVGFPAGDERLRAGDGHRLAVHRHGKDLVALGEGVGHQRGDRGDVDLQRVDAQVGLLGQGGQPLGEGFQVQLASGVGVVVELLGGDEFQRMLLGVQRTAADGQALFGAVLLEAALADQLAQQVVEVDPAILGGGGQGGHGLPRASGWREGQACREMYGLSPGWIMFRIGEAASCPALAWQLAGVWLTSAPSSPWS